MLYPPSNPSPYNSVVDAGDDLQFTVSCLNTSDIGGIQLSLKDNANEYYIPLKDNKNDGGTSPTQSCIASSAIEIPNSNFPIDAILDYANGYKIATNNYTRSNLSNISSITDIIKPFKQYRWQLRLYQKETSTPAINIGYGFIQQVITVYDNSHVVTKRRILKVRPHTNIFFDHSGRINYNSGVSKQLTQYYDTNAKYQIQLNGHAYDILDYYYAKTGANLRHVMTIFRPIMLTYLLFKPII